ncbi:arylsulfotransferase family protein [Spirillospora sp. NPDC029432]|uniref:arylsulfotransferase family protein n=1 Tax=Spirillospora sp. NPDC029432 TaxID=3154599 RepID=UPI003453DC6F
MAGAGLVGAAAVAGGVAAVRQEPARSAPVSGPERYVTRPDIELPEITVRRTGATAGGPLFLTPHRGTGQSDALIVDGEGRPVWFQRSERLITDLRVQTYRGEPVLTYWEGERLEGGHGRGTGIILDGSYRKIATVRTGNGVEADFHEFRLTDRGTALLIAYPKVKADLRVLGGARDGEMVDNRIQEVDVRTGRVLLDWSARRHLALDESFVEAGEGTLDPFHVNSVEADGETLLVSARNTHAVYSLDRRTGAVRWRLGGKRSDFEMGAAASFAWQHDARRVGGGRVSLFDNHIENAGDGPSRGIVLDVDEERRRASLASTFAVGPRFGQYMGNLQSLPGGNLLVGWGSTSGATEFAADGTVVMEIGLGGSASYRAYRMEWEGRPATRPDVAVGPKDGNRIEVHASWNGATGVAGWRILSGAAEGSLATAATVKRAGFETSAVIGRRGYVAVEALDAEGAVLARSAVRSVA